MSTSTPCTSPLSGAEIPTPPTRGSQPLPIARVDDWRRNRGLKPPRQRRRRLVELTRTFACIHPHCDKKYEAIRSLKHHLVACHGGVGMSMLQTVYNTKWHSVTSSQPAGTEFSSPKGAPCAPHSSTCHQTLQASTFSSVPHQSKLASSSHAAQSTLGGDQQHLHSILRPQSTMTTTTATAESCGRCTTHAQQMLSPELLAASFSRSLTTTTSTHPSQQQQFEAQQLATTTTAAVQWPAQAFPSPWPGPGHFPATTRKMDNDTQLMVAMSACLQPGDSLAAARHLQLHHFHVQPTSSASLPSTNVSSALLLPAWQLLGDTMPLDDDMGMAQQQQLLSIGTLRRTASAEPLEALQESMFPSFLDHFDSAQQLNLQLRSASAPLPDSPPTSTPLISFALDTQPMSRPGHTCLCSCPTSRLLTPESVSVTLDVSRTSTLTSSSSPTPLTLGTELPTRTTSLASSTPVLVPGEPTQTLPQAPHSPLRPTIARELLQDIYSDLVNLGT